MNQTPRSQGKRRGLTLSISREKRSQPSQPKITFNINSNQPIPNRKVPTVTFGQSSTNRVPSDPHRVPSATHRLPSPPPASFKVAPNHQKIIYRMKKSEWDLLQESNRSKKQVVHQYKHQIQSLGHQLNHIQNSNVQKVSLGSYRQKNMHPVISHQSFSQTLPVFPTQKINFEPLEIINQSPYREEPSTTSFLEIGQNSQSQDLLTFRKTQNYSIERSRSIVLKQNMENIEMTPYNALKTNKKQKNIESFQAGRRKSIDLGALSEIQNRLNELIRFTEA